MKSKPWQLLQALFLVTGLLSLGYAGYAYLTLYLDQEYESRQFDRTLAFRPAAYVPPSVQPLQRGTLIGRIVIPRLGISAMIKEGADAGTLRVAVGHIPSTALPGQLGNVGVSAHRDTLFRNLKDAQRDDVITLTTVDGEYNYQVVSLAVVDPTDVSVLAPSANQRTLTLITCYPFYFVGHAPKRFIVRALQLTPGVEHPTLRRLITAERSPGPGIVALPIAIRFTAGKMTER